VWLNAGSRLRYPVTFTGASREVWLEGEAYFEVSRSGAPFRTRVGSAVVEVLGTSFNVTGYADDPVVVATLSSGKVRVSVDGRPDERVELLPGGQAQVDAASGTITTREVDAGVYASWRESLFVFDDESLEAIARKLARWYDVEIEIASPSARGAVFYGVLPKYATIAVFLERVKQVYDMEYVIEGRKIVLI
jgi:ferric-dicitrate binding protein FerR (iron transport regulator)